MKPIAFRSVSVSLVLHRLLGQGDRGAELPKPISPLGPDDKVSLAYRDRHFEPDRLLIDRKSDADTCGWRGLVQTVRYSDGVIMRGKLLGQGGSAANRTANNNRQTEEFNVSGGCNVLDMKAAGRETQLEWVSVH